MIPDWLGALIGVWMVVIFAAGAVAVWIDMTEPREDDDE